MKKNVVLLGATGSIGDSTLRVLRQNSDKYALFAAVAQKNVEKMMAICQEFHPQYVVMTDAQAAKLLKEQLKNYPNILVLSDEAAIIELVEHSEADIVMAAIVGAYGLTSALAAAKAGKKILLANKEALVISGHLLMDAVSKNNATLLPVDSEHNALFQCLPKDAQGRSINLGVDSLILTASGGPFRRKTLAELQQVTLQEALKHPKWSMGAKITIDSASLMNKGLELIEAHFLFNMPVNKLKVVVHPESIIHSLVEYADGSFLAQMSNPDMCVPIAHALAYPQRIESGTQRMNLAEIAQLTFEAPDETRFPCLRLAKEALATSQSHLVALNAANEIAVDALLNAKIQFMQIPQIVEHILNKTSAVTLNSIEALLAFDTEIRTKTKTLIQKKFS